MPIVTTKPVFLRVRDGHELMAQHEKLGYGPRDIFVKTFDARYANEPGVNQAYRFKIKDWQDYDNSEHIADEFRRLRRLHDTAPQNVVAPIAAFADHDGMIKGYSMDFVEGIRLGLYIEQSATALVARYEVAPYQVFLQIAQTIVKFASAHTMHGDLSLKNIVITPYAEVKFVDPFPVWDVSDTRSVVAILCNAKKAKLISVAEHLELYNLLRQAAPIY